MKIGQILDKIDDKQIFVPAFQREYVWKRSDAKRLINSLVNEYPTGTMLTWETNNPPELKGDYIYQDTKGTVKIILDGQQRITTLYMLMRGTIPPYYKAEEIENDIRNLYVNLETMELEYYKEKSMENNPVWVNITDIFLGKVTTRDITDQLELRLQVDRLPKEQDKNISDNLRSIERILDRDFLEQVIPVRASIKEAIDIFYIVNSSGVNLTDAELALAQISGYWPQARELFKKKLQDLEKQGWVFKLDFLVFALLAVVHQMASKMEKLHGRENKENVQQAWSRLDGEIIDYVCNLLKSQAFVDHSDEINSVYALIPIILYVYMKPKPKLSEEEIKKIVRWFYYTQIRYRYISQLQQRLDKDLKIVAENATPFETLLAFINEERPLEIKPSEFIGRDIRNPLFSLMRWYFKSKGAICLGTGFSIRKNMGKKYSLERDHIFAYAVLRDSGYYDMNNQFDYQLAQEMTNRAILTQVENREKSAEFANVYLSRVKEQFPTALKLQCIPEDPELWEVENFHKFLEARRILLANELNHYLNNISIGFGQVSSTVDLLDMIRSGEHGYLELKSSMRWNWKENHLDKKMEEIILKTIAAFSNKDGGKLLIGVTDEGEVIGLEPDYATFKEPNKDQFELHLKNLVNQSFGKEFGATSLEIRFPIVDDVEICEIDIKAGSKPMYVEVSDKTGSKSKKFYLRSGNTSQELDIEETASFISKRFNFLQ